MIRSLAFVLALALPAAAADPKAVIEKAVAAHGGADKLDKFAGQRMTIKGTITAGGMEIELAGTRVWAFPDKEKMTATLTVGGQELPLVQVANGDKLSLTIGGEARPADDNAKADARLSVYSNALAARLTPLLKAAGPYTLKPGPDAAVDGSPAVGVVVEHKEFKPVTLYFDKESGRLVKMTRPGRGEGGEEAERETVYGDYKAVDGVQVPHSSSSSVGGKKLTSFKAEKVEMLEKVDDSEFVVE